MIEYNFDKLLGIRTGAEKKIQFPDSIQYNPYEPTPYSSLEVLFGHYHLNERDHVVDYGCGKGRMNFYIHHFYQAHVTGIEMDERFYEESLVNLEKYLKKTGNNPDTIEFLCCLAEEYKVQTEDNRFYFFNPFSIRIFRKVVREIMRSYSENERDMELVLYYADEDFIYYLEDETAFELKLEIPIPLLYDRNPYERFSIYRLG